VKHPAASDLQQAQAALDQASANLEKVKSPSSYDVQQAQEAVNQAQANLQKLQNPTEADITSGQQGVIAAQTAMNKLVNPSTYDVQQAQQAVVQAQANVDKLLTGNAYDVQTAQASLAQAQANLQKLQNGNTAQDIAQAQAAVGQAKAALDQAQANLDAATLIAPFTGTVAATGANLGEQVGASTALVTLVDTQQLRVDVTVGETDVAQIKPGQPATLTLDALPNQRVNGTVSVIAPTATTTNGVVTYTVQIQLDPQQAQAAGVRPGMTASASIVTQSRPNVVVAPNRAIKTQGQTKTVLVLDAEGKTETRQVRAGLSNDQSTEITSGLHAGEKVVIPATSTAASVRMPGAGGPPPF
jgi:RND family efflux transporter MFP subunit